MKSKQSFIFERLRANFMHHEQEGDKSPLSPWLRAATEDEMVTLSELAFIYFTSLHIYSSCKQPIHMVDYNPSLRPTLILCLCGGFLDGNTPSETISTPVV